MKRAALSVAIASALALGAAPASAARPAKVTGTITVLAASSLTEAFTEMETRFEKKYAGADVVLSFNSSSVLATQLQQGAPADVIATADEANMDTLVDAGQVAPDSFSNSSGTHPYVVFTRNRLEVAVAPGNPLGIKTLADTLDDKVTLVLCVPEAPCGKYALEAFEHADLPAPAVPTGANAKDTITKVTLGEADAAIVYVTDVKTAGDDVDGVKIPTSQNVIASYPIAPIAGAPNGAGAKAFTLFVESKAGQKILKSFGFLAP